MCAIIFLAFDKHNFLLCTDRSEDGGSYKVADELSSNRDSSFEGNSSPHPGAAWRATPAGEHTSALLHNSRDVSSDARPRKSDVSSHQPKDPHSPWESKLGFVSESKEVGKWHASSEDPIVKRQLSGVLESEIGTRRAPPTAPEELSLLYKDPKGLIQGPFKGIDIIGWFEAGYFGIDLPVRLENSAVDSPWFSLGDVMPHLRAKARPPPGFSAPQPNELADMTGRQNPTTFGNALTGLSEVEMLKSDSRHRQGSGTGVESRYLESLMSGNRSGPAINNLALSEGSYLLYLIISISFDYLDVIFFHAIMIFLFLLQLCISDVLRTRGLTTFTSYAIQVLKGLLEIILVIWAQRE